MAVIATETTGDEMDGITVRLYSRGGGYMELCAGQGSEQFDGVFNLLLKAFAEPPCLTWVTRKRGDHTETVVIEPKEQT